jgi:carboxymethylenebutenolidase
VWNTFATNGPAGVNAAITTFTAANQDAIHAYVAVPADSIGPIPGIVLVHHVPGWDEFFQEFAERLARHGYEVICPDLYCRFGHGTPEGVAAKVRSQGGVHDDVTVADCHAALQWLKSRPTNNGKVGIIGTCSGGRHALLAASQVPGFDAVIDLWGGGVVVAPDQATPARPVAPIEFTENLHPPLLGLFGNDDKSPSPEQVDAHEVELKRLGKSYIFRRYDGAGHGFFYYHTPAYRYEQAMDAWERVFRFFGEHLSG